MTQLILTPPRSMAGCLICGNTRLDDSGTPEEVIHHVGGDVNFGEMVELCQQCVGAMADLIGRVPTEKYAKLTDRLSDAEAKAQELETELTQEQEDRAALQEKVDRILGGAKAKRELKEATA